MAGAKLSHLVQKDKAWDPGSMTEQVRIIFTRVQKANNTGNLDSLKRYLTESCYHVLSNELDHLKKNNRTWQATDWTINEISILEVRPGKGKKADAFVAYIKAALQDNLTKSPIHELIGNSCTLHWTFENQNGWWVLKEMKGRVNPENNLIK